MIDAAAASVSPDASAAHALTESYVRLRREVSELAQELGLGEEFAAVFPEVAVAEPPTASLAGNLGRQFNLDLQAEAKRASTLLGQLAGWVQGLIDEQTFEQRIAAEAEAKATLAAKPPTGFTTET
jgi:hypothetical protein